MNRMDLHLDVGSILIARHMVEMSSAVPHSYQGSANCCFKLNTSLAPAHQSPVP